MNLITDLDKAVETRIKFLEDKFNVLIDLKADDDNFYMDVTKSDLSSFEDDILLCSKNSSKFALASAIRAHFIKS